MREQNRPRIGITMRIELETERFYLARYYSEAALCDLLWRSDSQCISWRHTNPRHTEPTSERHQSPAGRTARSTFASRAFIGRQYGGPTCGFGKRAGQ